jgi:hypothetical protein
MDKAARCTGRRSGNGRQLPVSYPGEPTFLATEQLAELWCVSAMSVYRQVHQGSLPAIRIGDPDKGRLVIPTEAVEPYRSSPPTAPLRPYHRLGAAARFLGVSYGHLQREVQAGRFPGVRIRSLWLVPNPAINAMVQAAIECGGQVLASDFGDWSDRTTHATPPGRAGEPTIGPAACVGHNQPAVS